MIFSKACEYGIKATLHIAVQSLDSRRVSLKDIAREVDSPVAFTAKILQKLVRDGILISVKGPTGGFEIPKKRMDEIRLIEIVSCIDGDEVFTGCGLGLRECNAEFPCPVHHKFKSIRDGLKDMLSQTTIFELATGVEVGASVLKR